jgi:nucleoid DNA-binding protein
MNKSELIVKVSASAVVVQTDVSRNPSEGAAIQISAKNTPVFKAGGSLGLRLINI